MPASYPTSAKTFTTKSDGAGNTILAAHINDLQLEVTAIETDLIAGLPVARGGTGNTSITANRIPYGNGTSALQTSASLTFNGTTLTAPATTITGALTISGASAGQIVFPATQNAAADVNTLDDYEEGSWTPVIGGSGGTSGQTYGTQVGRYVKIGTLVMATYNAILTAKGTITTSVQIQGLPFTARNQGSFNPISSVLWANTVSSYVCLVASMQPNATAATLFGATAAATSLATLATADNGNTTQFVGTIVYLADS